MTELPSSARTPSGGDSEASEAATRRALPDSARWAFARVWRACPGLTAALLGVTALQVGVPAGLALFARGLINGFMDAPTGAGVALFAPWLALGFVLTTIGAVGPVLTKLLRARLVDELRLRLSIEILEHAAGLDLAFFEDPESRTIIDRAQQSPAEHLAKFVDSVLEATLALLQAVGLAAVLGAMEPLALIVVGPLTLPYLLFRWRLSRQLYRTEHSRTPKRRWTTYFISKLTNRTAVAETKLLGLPPLFTERYHELITGFRDQDRKLHLRAFIGTATFAILMVTASFGVFSRVLSRTLAQQLTVGDLAVFLGASTRLRTSLQRTILSLGDALSQVLFVGDLRRFLAERPAVRSAAADAVSFDTDGRTRAAGLSDGPPGTGGSLEFDNVTFTYNGADSPTLRNVAVTIEPGEVVGIVGENGAGKTTFVKLACRLYDPDSGSVLLDGVDLCSMSPEKIHRRVTAIFQGYGRYEATAAENVAYGDHGNLLGHPDAIARVARRGGAHHTIEAMPEGYDTLLGRMFGRHEPSGGQWQRPAVARAFARDADVLILDEPTSHLDARAEHDFYESFRDLAGKRTTLLVSNRFSTLRMADRIVVLHEGRLIETGSHDELLSARGHYASLYNLHRQAMYARGGSGEAGSTAPSMTTPSLAAAAPNTVSRRTSGRCRFSFGAAGVDVKASDEHLEWLEEFLLPSFEIGDSAAMARQIVVVEDTTLFEAIANQVGSRETSLAECFALDSAVLRLPSWRDESGTRLVFDEKFQVAYRLQDPTWPDSEIEIVAPTQHRRLRVPLMRIVRELASAHARRTGALMLHASALTVSGRAILFAGPRRAGKTSLLVHGLGAPETRYLANDRVAATLEGGSVVAQGMPTIVTIRSSAFEHLPHLQDRLADSTLDHHCTIRECVVDGRRLRPWNDGRYGLSPAQFCDLLETGASGKTTAAALVFPTITDQPGGIEVERLRPEKAAERLPRALLGADGPTASNLLFDIPEAGRLPSHAATSELARLIAENINAFECRVGLSAFAVGERARLFDALLD